jgi:hypothetical protein
MKLRLFIAGVLSATLLLNADTVNSVFASILAQHTGTVLLGAGSYTADLSTNCGDVAFSQCGLRFNHNGVNTAQIADNLNSTAVSQQFPGFFDALTIYDNVDGVDRVETLLGGSAPLFLQPQDGFVGVGQFRSTPQLLSVGGSVLTFDPTQLASESLTNPSLTGGTSWTCTNDCSYSGSNSFTWAFSAGTASTLTQTSGTLAIAGIGLRMYKFVYTVSGVTGTPSANITSAFANTIGSAALANLDIVSGSHTLYFQAVGSTGNFVITSTLTAGQGFTLASFSLKQVIAGTLYTGGPINTLHLGGNGSPPTVAAGGAISTTPTIAGNDLEGTVSVPSTAVTTGTIATVTFGTAYAVAPRCQVTQNGGLVALGIGHGTPGTGSFTITAAIANVSAAAYSFDYVCTGN